MGQWDAPAILSSVLLLPLTLGTFSAMTESSRSSGCPFLFVSPIFLSPTCTCWYNLACSNKPHPS